jgi:hypothetical protein
MHAATGGARGPKDASPDEAAGLDAVPLVDAEHWQLVESDLDPFADWADGDIVCSPIAGFYPEHMHFWCMGLGVGW